MKQEPDIHVGIMAAENVTIMLDGAYLCNDGAIEGIQHFAYTSQGIAWSGKTHNTLLLTPQDETTASFLLHDVTIGIGFHWQRKENQRFRGAIQLIIEEDKIRVINRVKIEEYLRSVISSEMSATASIELLKAHAIISRSWLMAQIAKRGKIDAEETPYRSHTESDTEIIRWYDREEHHNYDVCADDHCQRYQGITRATTPSVDEAVKATYGTVLWYDGKIADARFSKCCGGITELFENCWEPTHHPYLTALNDSTETVLPDLCDEQAARQWICSSPDAFCNTTDKEILSQVLNNYDQETTRFYRWKVTYRQSELSDLVRQRSGIDFGTILNLEPVERGSSGRIIRLRITGSHRTLIVGKELEIRRWLSNSHLYSSAFVVDKETSPNGELCFTLHGAGWGHGVGLCQIGAAVMGDKGYRYDEILSHYFTDVQLTQLYKDERDNK